MVLDLAVICVVFSIASLGPIFRYSTVCRDCIPASHCLIIAFTFREETTLRLTTVVSFRREQLSNLLVQLSAQMIAVSSHPNITNSMLKVEQGGVLNGTEIAAGNTVLSDVLRTNKEVLFASYLPTRG